MVFHLEIFQMETKSPPMHGMNLLQLNNMSFPYIFSMLIELITNSKELAIILPILVVLIAMITRTRTLQRLVLLESILFALMSVSMSIMLIGMVRPDVIMVIQLVLNIIQLVLLVEAIRSYQASSFPKT
jgi:hypothetical protein